MKYLCDKCGKSVEFSDTYRLTEGGKIRRYCEDCIEIAQNERRERLLAERKAPRRTPRSKSFTAGSLASRKNKAESMPVQTFINTIKEEGLPALDVNDLPFRLKRGEIAHFIAGKKLTNGFEISLALTNTRLFYSSQTGVHKNFKSPRGQSIHLSVLGGIKSVPLASVIALDEPSPDPRYRNWETGLHLASGIRLALEFSTCPLSRQFYALIAELIDRLNDPIDETSFSPKRERISDEVKVAVWRRDEGCCVKCGSRGNLEYDHIIPVSKGGSNTIRNIELLCETCNRKKSNRIS